MFPRRERFVILVSFRPATSAITRQRSRSRWIAKMAEIAGKIEDRAEVYRAKVAGPIRVQ